jgi:hypothetical protein
MSATVREVPAWELSATMQCEPDAHLIDLFFRVHQPHYTKEGERHVLTIPPKSPTEYPEAWVSTRGQSLTDFLVAITFARQTERVRAATNFSQERAA